MDDVPVGLYDQLIDVRLDARLHELAAHRLQAAFAKVDAAELPDRVGEVVGRWVGDALRTVTDEERTRAAIELAAGVLEAIAAQRPDSVDEGQRLAEPLRRLTAVERLGPADTPLQIAQPLTPLRDTVLMTNARDEPGVGQELLKEIESADRIDVVLAFIRWSGIRLLLPALRRHVEAGRQLRVITTTYTGSTELRALEALREIGAEVRVSYDTTTTRLHAKAWHFHRRSGFSTVYIGSSNLTFSAQVTGIEWNVRASQRLNPDLVAAFDRVFTTYWADPHFEPFATAPFVAATAQAAADDSILTPFDISPYPFQEQILERLRVDRRRGFPHNLVVAATGTGKTMIAGFDYRRLRSELGRSRLLFVAHREEILTQSRTAFRHILRDGSFGELWVGGARPTVFDHVFASVQSLAATDLDLLDPEHFDVVIVDEFHHAAASTYQRLLDHVRPVHLLGLTATPERADGLHVLGWFGGRTCVELRLWDALEQGLLAPFHYFGISDGTDLSAVSWRAGGGYDTTELTNLYTADHVWAGKVVEAVNRTVGAPRRMRALAFCVSIDHAEFMAERFVAAGLEARAVTARTSTADRAAALRELADGDVQVLCTVDLFNEGVDIPSVDVVLMLRPTESATVFLQQLGRGLRKATGKDVLTVLDFVGQQRREFRFDRRFRAMLGRSRTELVRDIDEGFPYLPAGCHLELDPVARDIVLDNVRHSLPTTWPRRIAELRALGDVDLPTYLAGTGLELGDVYAGGRSWTELRRAAGLTTGAEGPDETRIGRGVGRLLHLDDLDRIETYQLLLAEPEPPRLDELDGRTARQFQGLLLTLLDTTKGRFGSIDEAAALLWRHEGLRRELLELLPLLEQQVVHLHQPLGLLQPVPLQVHATYTREEILGAFGASTVSEPLPLQTGVYWHGASATDLLFVTLRKAERDYSPTTRYLDYAVSTTLFHWESQAATAEDSVRGRNYVEHVARGRNVALFVRERKTDDARRTVPYFCAGLATYVGHEGERPMRITWRLHHPLPGDVFAAYRAAVA
jgi:superfamily II DNA or RNA helicase/HKD family nuclease